MKRIALAVLSILAVAALAAFAPAPKPIRTLGLAKVAATDSTVSYTATVTLRSGTLRPGDKIRFNWFLNGTLVPSPDTTALTVTQTFKAACGTSGTVKVAVKFVYFDTGVDSRTVTATANYTQAPCPVPPPPVIDTVQLSPASATLTPGQQFRFTIPA